MSTDRDGGRARARIAAMGRRRQRDPDTFDESMSEVQELMASADFEEDAENFEENVSDEIRSAFGHTDDPLERMTKEEQLKLLTQAIAKLPEEFREALMLSEYEGMTYDEIGKLTGASLSTIRIRIFRAKARLRKMLLPVIGDEVDKLIPKPDDIE